MIKYQGEVNEVINHYLSDNLATCRETKWSRENAPYMNGVRLISARIANKEDILYAGDAIYLEFEIESEDNHFSEYNITFLVKDEMNNFLFEGSSEDSRKEEIKTGAGTYYAKAIIPANLLNEGTYRIWRIFFVKDKVTLQFYYDDAISFELKRRENYMYGYQGGKMGLIHPQTLWKMYYNNREIVNDIK